MSWSDVETPQFSIFEKSKPCISFNTGYITNVLFKKMEVIVVSSNNLWKIGQINSLAFVV